MPVDASIYGQVQQPQQINPLASLAQAYQVKGMQSQMDKADRAEAQQNKLLSLVQTPDFQKLDAQGKANALQGLGDFENAGKVITSAAAANKDQRAADQTGLDMAIKRHEAMSGAMMVLSKDPSQAQQVIGQLVQGGIMDPAYGQKVLQSAAQAPDPSQFFMQGAQAAVSAKDQLAQRIQQQTQEETSRHNQTTETLTASGQAVQKRGQDLTDARAREANQTGRIPTGYRPAADGTLEFIPGGPADPAAAKKAAPTEFQGKSAAFGSRAQESDRILNELGGSYSPTGINTKNALGNTPLIGGALEATANAALSDNSQKAEQAQRDFMNAILRQESGAAIGKDEFNNGKRQYFPQPGDSQAVIEQKAANRRLAVQGLLNNAGNATVATPQPAKAAPAQGVMSVTNAADYAKVPSGATYTTPDGKTRRKP